MPVPAEACQLKQSLIRRCDETARTYSEALNNLRHRMATSTLVEYGHLYSQSEYARMDMERARLEYQQHTTEHGC
jgi:hypothetical protein